MCNCSEGDLDIIMAPWAVWMLAEVEGATMCLKEKFAFHCYTLTCR